MQCTKRLNCIQTQEMLSLSWTRSQAPGHHKVLLWEFCVILAVAQLYFVVASHFAAIGLECIALESHRRPSILEVHKRLLQLHNAILSAQSQKPVTTHLGKIRTWTLISMRFWPLNYRGTNREMLCVYVSKERSLFARTLQSRRNLPRMCNGN